MATSAEEAYSKGRDEGLTEQKATDLPRISTASAYLDLRQECWGLARAIAVSKQQVEQEGDREQRDTTMLRLVSSVGKVEDAALKEQILLILPPQERPKFSTLLEEYSIYKGNIERIAKEKEEQ